MLLAAVASTARSGEAKLSCREIYTRINFIAHISVTAAVAADILAGVRDQLPSRSSIFLGPPRTFRLRSSEDQRYDFENALCSLHTKTGSSFIKPSEPGPRNLLAPMGTSSHRRWMTGDQSRILNHSACSQETYRDLSALQYTEINYHRPSHHSARHVDPGPRLFFSTGLLDVTLQNAFSRDGTHTYLILDPTPNFAVSGNGEVVLQSCCTCHIMISLLNECRRGVAHLNLTCLAHSSRRLSRTTKGG